MYLLIDCNNFFVSCERVFKPSLEGKPVVVVSGNEGCVIARSNEAKALHIPMGAPCFKYADLFKYHKVVSIPTNFCLYGDMSSRVFETVLGFDLPMEIYSIDEAFVFAEEGINYIDLASQIRKRVKQWVGIPVSIGIGPTKTLAKVAAHFAKKEKSGVYQVPSPADPILAKLAIGDVWGVGRQYAKLLTARGVLTALDLTRKDELWVKKHLKVFGLRTYLELKEISCNEEEETEFSRKSLMYTRSFKQPLIDQEEIIKTLISFIEKALQKLRKSKAYAGYMKVFLMTNRFHKEDFYYGDLGEVASERTHFTPFWIEVARRLFAKIYIPGKKYKRIGVLFTDLSEKEGVQRDLFAKSPKNDSLMKTIDEINHKYRKPMISFAYPPEKTKGDREYTTNWDQILHIDI